MIAGSDAERQGGRSGEAAELADLLKRVAARDAAAFSALYKRTSARLYGVVARILAGGEAAEALQEAYVRVWEKAGDFDPAKGSALAWMATIARNRALDEVRRVRPPSASLDEGEGFELADEAVDPLAARERSEALSALIGCLERLEKDKRSMVLLAYYHGLSREALAKRFGAPAPTIKTWLRRSLAQLRDCLAS